MLLSELFTLCVRVLLLVVLLVERTYHACSVPLRLLLHHALAVGCLRFFKRFAATEVCSECVHVGSLVATFLCLPPFRQERARLLGALSERCLAVYPRRAAHCKARVPDVAA